MHIRTRTKVFRGITFFPGQRRVWLLVSIYVQGTTYLILKLIRVRVRARAHALVRAKHQNYVSKIAQNLENVCG